MPEVPGILNNSPTARQPAADTWKLLYTVPPGQTATLSIHINNGSGADSGYRIAIIPASAGYVDGAAPPSYSVVAGSLTASHPLENLNWDDTPTFNLDEGAFVVVYAEDAGVTFLPTGFLFS